MIVLIAFLIRLSPILLYEPLLREFDPYYFYRNVQYILANGFPAWYTWIDYSAWTPFGRNVALSTYPGMVFTAVIIYQILTAIGINISSFSVVYYMPVVFGALTPVITFFIGKEMYDKRSGILAAFFIAVSPAIIQRQVIGFFDNEPFGIFVMLFAFYFFIRSLKRGSIPSAIMAGLFLGYICVSWGTFNYVVDILALFTGVMLVARRYSIRLFSAYNITMALGLFIATLAPRNGLRILTSGEVLPALFLSGLLIAYETFKYLAKIPLFSGISKRIGTLNPFLLAVVIGVGSIVILTLSPIGGKFLTVLLPIFREQQARILASVGEHQPTAWAGFFYYLGIVVLLSIVGLYFSFKRLQDVDVFFILAAVTLLYFAGSMVRILITLSPILAVLAGYGLSSMMRPFGKIIATPREDVLHRKRARITPAVGREYAVAAFFVMGLLLFAYGNTIISVPPGGGQITMLQSMSPPEILPQGSFRDWLEALSWLNNQAPPGAVVVSWWDYGYYITCVGNRTSVDDNGTGNSTQIGLVGLGFMQTNETASLEIFRRWNASYALVYFGHMQSWLGGDEGKWIWMLRIAADNFGSQGLIDESKYFNESSQKTLPLYFNTTLYRLMFNGEPAGTGSLDSRLVYSMGIAALGNMATKPFPAIAPNHDSLDTLNTNWQSYLAQYSINFPLVETLDEYGPRFFTNPYVSVNHLVKIYHIDYSPLDMRDNFAINATDTHVFTNGTALITVKNNALPGGLSIPLNSWSDGERYLRGSVWLNNTQKVSIWPTIYIWDTGSSSWVPYSTSYSISPGASAKFRITGLDSQILGRAYNSSTSIPLKVVAAYDEAVSATAQVYVEGP